MPRRARADWDAVNAAAPLGLILVRDLLAFGVPSSTIAFRCRARGGNWWSPLSGLVALARGTPTDRQRLEGALLYGGAESLVTGVAACRLYGLERVPDDDRVHLLVRHETRRRSQGFVLVERTERMPSSRVRDGVRCAPVHRAVLDAARRLTRLDEARALLAEAVQRRMTTVAALRQELEAGSCRGTALVRAVLVELESGVRSASEAWCREIVAGMEDMPPVRWNASLYWADGTFLACVDGFVDELALAIEVDSFEYHADPVAFDATLRRQALLTGAGVLVLAVTPRRLQADPELVRRDLRRACEQARARPRPDLRAA